LKTGDRYDALGTHIASSRSGGAQRSLLMTNGSQERGKERKTPNLLQGFLPVCTCEGGAPPKGGRVKKKKRFPRKSTKNKEKCDFKFWDHRQKVSARVRWTPSSDIFARLRNYASKGKKRERSENQRQ